MICTAAFVISSTETADAENDTAKDETTKPIIVRQDKTTAMIFLRIKTLLCGVCADSSRCIAVRQGTAAAMHRRNTGSTISHSTQFAAHACPVRRRKGVLRSAGIVLTDQRICRSPDNPPEMCHLLELVCRLHCTRPVRVYRTKADGRREFPTDQRVLVHGAVVTVQLLLYHVCNRFARLSDRIFRNFCTSAQNLLLNPGTISRNPHPFPANFEIYFVTF